MNWQYLKWENFLIHNLIQSSEGEVTEGAHSYLRSINSKFVVTKLIFPYLLFSRRNSSPSWNCQVFLRNPPCRGDSESLNSRVFCLANYFRAQLDAQLCIFVLRLVWDWFVHRGKVDSYNYVWGNPPPEQVGDISTAALADRVLSAKGNS